MDVELKTMNKVIEVLRTLPSKTDQAWVLGYVAHKLGLKDESRQIAQAIASGETEPVTR